MAQSDEHEASLLSCVCWVVTAIVWSCCWWSLGHGDCPVVSSRPSDLRQKRSDDRKCLAGNMVRSDDVDQLTVKLTSDGSVWDSSRPGTDADAMLMQKCLNGRLPLYLIDDCLWAGGHQSGMQTACCQVLELIRNNSTFGDMFAAANQVFGTVYPTLFVTYHWLNVFAKHLKSFLIN